MTESHPDHRRSGHPYVTMVARGGWLPGVTVLVGDRHPALPPVVRVLRKLPLTISKPESLRGYCPSRPLTGGRLGVALLPKHLFHQPSYLSFDTGAPLPCLRWAGQVLLQLQTHINLNCIMQVYDVYYCPWKTAPAEGENGGGSTPPQTCPTDDRMVPNIWSKVSGVFWRKSGQ